MSLPYCSAVEPSKPKPSHSHGPQENRRCEGKGREDRTVKSVAGASREGIIDLVSCSQPNVMGTRLFRFPSAECPEPETVETYQAVDSSACKFHQFLGVSFVLHIHDKFLGTGHGLPTCHVFVVVYALWEGCKSQFKSNLSSFWSWYRFDLFDNCSGHYLALSNIEALGVPWATERCHLRCVIAVCGARAALSSISPLQLAASLA